MSALSVVRYGVYWVALDPTQGHAVQKRRPCVVVSPYAMHRSGMAVVCPCTTSLHKRWPYRIQVNFEGRANEIMPDRIRAVSLERLEVIFVPFPRTPLTGCVRSLVSCTQSDRSRRSGLRRYEPDFSVKRRPTRRNRARDSSLRNGFPAAIRQSARLSDDTA